MSHADARRLSEYLEGSLAEGERAALERHLRVCGGCHEELEALREMVATLGGLPRTGRPGRDLWPGVAARTVNGIPATEISEARRRRRRRRLEIGFPQAAAAAALVALLAGGVVWLILSGGNTDPGSVPRAAAPVPQLVATTVGQEDYDRAVADLTRQLNQSVDGLDPGTVAAIGANLAVIDSAIMEIDEALAREPDNSYLSAYLARAMRKKVDVLRQTLAQCGSASVRQCGSGALGRIERRRS